MQARRRASDPARQALDDDGGKLIATCSVVRALNTVLGVIHPDLHAGKRPTGPSEMLPTGGYAGAVAAKWPVQISLALGGTSE